MSNIYIQEPPTSGKVVLHTSLGDFDVELFSKETPKACRNFVQLCMEGYYDGTIFHRVVKNFIAQGGDPTGTGVGGESIYGEHFKNEVHSRLRFFRRGLVACASAGKDQNGSQFFFTLGPTPDLQNEHTIFGKVTGNTQYNLTKFDELETDQNERPTYPPKIISTEVLNNPFPDIIPREKRKKVADRTKADKPKIKGTKNLKLLSFGDEAEEEEEETTKVVQVIQSKGKGKSSHDLANDPKLVNIPALSLEPDKKDEGHEDQERLAGDVIMSQSLTSKDDKEQLDRIKDKLKAKKTDDTKPALEVEKKADENQKEKTERDLIREEFETLKRELIEKKRAVKQEEKEAKRKKIAEEEAVEKNDLLRFYKEQRAKYQAMKKDLPGKGSSREAATLAMLQKFQDKLHGVKEKVEETPSEEIKIEPMEQPAEEPGEIVEDLNSVVKDEIWMAHALKFEEKGPILAKDASTKDESWYEVFDPRNPLAKRRREGVKLPTADENGA